MERSPILTISEYLVFDNIWSFQIIWFFPQWSFSIFPQKPNDEKDNSSNVYNAYYTIINGIF